MTSFSSFFDDRKCESCREGIMVRGGDVDEEVMDCPDPCPRRKDVEYVAEQFDNWLDNVETKLNIYHFVNMSAVMNAKYNIIGYYPKDSEAFYDWLDKNGKNFTADDYFAMGSAV